MLIKGLNHKSEYTWSQQVLYIMSLLPDLHHLLTDCKRVRAPHQNFSARSSILGHRLLLHSDVLVPGCMN